MLKFYKSFHELVSKETNKAFLLNFIKNLTKIWQLQKNPGGKTFKKIQNLEDKNS